MEIENGSVDNACHTFSKINFLAVLNTKGHVAVRLHVNLLAWITALPHTQ